MAAADVTECRDEDEDGQPVREGNRRIMIYPERDCRAGSDKDQGCHTIPKLPVRIETTLERLSAVLPKQSSTNPQLCSPGASGGICDGVRAKYANEPVAAPDFRTNEIAVRAQCFAQVRDLDLEVLVRHSDAQPRASEKFLFCDERTVGLQQDQKDVQGPRAELNGNTVGEQPPPAQQHAETSKFDGCVVSYRAPPGCTVR
jgi:hypothetical protein